MLADNAKCDAKAVEDIDGVKPDCSTVRVDRTRCGLRYDVVHVRDFLVRPQNRAVKLRVVMDRHSLELFVNDGEQAATFLLYTPESADSISFEARGAVLVDVEKYDLNSEFLSAPPHSV